MITCVIHNPKNQHRFSRIQETMRVQGGLPIWIEANMIPKAPMRGISQSHKTCIRKAMELGADKVCIIEDDVLFLKPNALFEFKRLYYTIPEDADIFLSGLYDGFIGESKDGVAKVEGRISGLHCYIIRKKFFDRVLEADEKYNIDFWMTSPAFGKAVTYVAIPFLALQHEGYSDNVKKVVHHNEGIKQRYKQGFL